MTAVMDVLNPVIVPVFNHLIEESRKKLAGELPAEVQIPLASDREGLPDPVVTMEVSDEERMDYIRQYVDELDLFGDDLYGHPVDAVFKACVTKEESAALAGTKEMTPDIRQICESIWNRAYGMIMDQVKDDICMDAQCRFQEDLYGRAYREYYEKRDSSGCTQADRDYMNRDLEQDGAER